MKHRKRIVLAVVVLEYLLVVWQVWTWAVVLERPVPGVPIPTSNGPAENTGGRV